EVLKQHGYNTSWYGKNHNVPDWQTSEAGPFDLWPTGLGFNYFYGFIGGDTDQWHPALVEGTKPIEPYFGKPDYILDVDLADHAIDWIRKQKASAPQRPFLAYYATGTAHAPHHAPRSGSPSSRASSTRGGTRSARTRWHARRSLASSQPIPNCRRGPRSFPPGTACPPTKRGSMREWPRSMPALSPTQTTTSAE